MHQLHPVHQTCGFRNVKFSHQCQQLHKMKRALPLNGLKHVLRTVFYSVEQSFVASSQSPNSQAPHRTIASLILARTSWRACSTVNLELGSSIREEQPYQCDWAVCTETIRPCSTCKAIQNQWWRLRVFQILEFSWYFENASFCRPCRLPTASKVSVARTPPPSPLSSPKRLISQPIICNPKPQSRSIAHDVMMCDAY